MPASIARATARVCAAGSPLTISPPTAPQPNPIAEMVSPVRPSARCSIGLYLPPGILRAELALGALLLAVVAGRGGRADRHGDRRGRAPVADLGANGAPGWPERLGRPNGQPEILGSARQRDRAQLQPGLVGLDARLRQAVAAVREPQPHLA